MRCKLLTSPTCPKCPPVKMLLQNHSKDNTDFFLELFDTSTPEGMREAEKHEITALPAAVFYIRNRMFKIAIGFDEISSFIKE